MERLLVTQALDERDLLKKKISDSIRRCAVVSTARPSDTKVATGVKIEDFEADAKASFQSVTDLIDRYERLDSAILLANATEEIDVAGKVMTRAAAINMRKNLVSSSRSTGTDFRGMLISKLSDDLEDAKTAIARTQAMADKQKDIMISNISSAEKKELTSDALVGVNTYCTNLVSTLVDPIKAEDKLVSLVEERDAFIKNIESAIKISNATTYIEF